jgi:hypothetical protein
LCGEALPGLYLQEDVQTSFEIGEYWDKSSQIDIVGYREDGWTDLGECKWGTVRSPAALQRELAEKVGIIRIRGMPPSAREFLHRRN